MSLSAREESDIRSAVAALIDRAFAHGEVVAWSLAREEVEGFASSLEEHLVLQLSTSAGDTFRCSAWQAEVPGAHDPVIVDQHLSAQLEMWFPTSALAWGHERRIPRA